jgi:hypothetical protein
MNCFIQTTALRSSLISVIAVARRARRRDGG